MYEVKGKAHRYAVFFLCELNKGEIILSDEHSKYEWLNYEELMNIVEKEPERARAGITLLNKLKEKGLL